MRAGITSVLNELGIQGFVTGIGSMWGTHFSSTTPTSAQDKLADNRTASRLLAAYLLLGRCFDVLSGASVFSQYGALRERR